MEADPFDDRGLSVDVRRRVPPHASAVKLSAGKKHSSASSDSVISTGVPKTVVVLKIDSTPASVTSWSTFIHQ